MPNNGKIISNMALLDFFLNFAKKCPPKRGKNRQIHLAPKSSSTGSKIQKEKNRKMLEVKPFKPFLGNLRIQSCVSL